MSAGKNFRKRRGGDYILDFGFYNMDCMDGMKHFPDKYFELAIVDPPYGINVANMNMGAGKGKRCSDIAHRGWTNKDWDIGMPDDAYFQELFRVSKHQIIWGGVITSIFRLASVSLCGTKRKVCMAGAFRNVKWHGQA